MARVFGYESRAVASLYLLLGDPATGSHFRSIQTGVKVFWKIWDKIDLESEIPVLEKFFPPGRGFSSASGHVSLVNLLGTDQGWPGGYSCHNLCRFTLLPGLPVPAAFRIKARPAARTEKFYWAAVVLAGDFGDIILCGHTRLPVSWPRLSSSHDNQPAA